MSFMKNLLLFLIILTLVSCQQDWANPLDRTDYPNMDIGHY